MRIAITGGIAEGKSTVLGYLADFGYSTASGDEFAREVFSDPAVQTRLSQLLGREPPVSASALREALRDSIGTRRAVNRIMHAPVAAKIAACPATFIEVPLLIETCLQPAFDAVWVVTCGPEEQLRRLVQRYGEDTANELVDYQLSATAKMPFGDVIVRTNYLPDTVKCFVKQAAETMLSSWIARNQG